MKAAVYKGKQRFSVDEIPTPEPGPGQVLVKVKYSAICGTDVHAFLYDRARPGTIMGHEYSGTVAELGPGVSTWSVGDRVVGLGGAFPSGMGPRYVVDPRFNYREMGYEVSHNGYAEYVVAEEWQSAAIPDGVSDEAAALAEPCGVAVRAVRNSALRLGDTVVVIGAGPIGMFCVQAARAAGASAVFVSEPAPARAEAALSAGADAVFDPTTEDVVAKVAEATGGLGPHVTFECVGVGKTLDQAMDMVRAVWAGGPRRRGLGRDAAAALGLDGQGDQAADHVRSQVGGLRSSPGADQDGQDSDRADGLEGGFHTPG